MAAALSLGLATATAAPAASPPAPDRARAAKQTRTVLGEVDRVQAAGVVPAAVADGYREVYGAAKASLKKLTGARRNELGGVLRTIDAVAAAGNLTSSRMPLAFLTIRRNREWWTTGSLLAYGQRVTFKGSSMVWQAYPGQGIQVQWLGTFGKANSLMAGGQRRYDNALKALLQETTSLASVRAGGIAWESFFVFDGGAPPWVSALSQGTALQAYSRAAVHLKDPALFDVARSALGIFRVAPPTGVRVGTSSGANLLIYSFAPKLDVLNAFTQAVNGLHDFAVLARDEEGQRLYREAEAELRVALPRFDTGAWSLYSLKPRESDLGYHTLLRDFLAGLCDRTTADRRRAARATTRQDGGAAPVPAPPTPTSAVDPATLPDPAVYCDTAARFTADLRTPPVIALAGRPKPAKPKRKKEVSLGYTLSKVSTVTTSVTLNGKGIAGRTVRLSRGQQRLRFTPKKAGRYAVSVRAVDLAGNAAQTSGSIAVGG
ncbi:hypothetical protein DSM112329_01538 [Paraconexibacter sp. AEG42_29]|uniref:D-glucuronyl C5-epimerase C-terminal domain-containing protein n=1 Tax=Paraconexibacter sp. AEG42_29 TaxID=2997339 RepID=A0AAU7AT83_9ACTN